MTRLIWGGLLFIVCTLLIYWQTHHVILVSEPLPAPSHIYRDAAWSYDQDPWISAAMHRRYLGTQLIHVSTRKPLAHWVDHGYITDDYQIIQDSEVVDTEKLLRISGQRSYIEESFELLSHLYATGKHADLLISDVGTMTVVLPQNRRFVLGRSAWLEQWAKAEKILRKHPEKAFCQYDLRYHDGFAYKALPVSSN